MGWIVTSVYGPKLLMIVAFAIYSGMSWILFGGDGM